jgi:hypothetical protein
VAWWTTWWLLEAMVVVEGMLGGTLESLLLGFVGA